MSLLSQDESISIGNDAGWALEFRTVDGDGTIADTPAAFFRSDDYYAEIDATLQDGLTGGAYTITIEGLIDSDYQQISQAQAKRPVAAMLYLYWNDTITGPVSYLRSIAGLSSGPSAADMKHALVAVLYVANVTRKLGSLSYDTEIRAVEWAYHMMRQPLQAPLREDFYHSVCLDIYERTQVFVNTFPESGRLTVDKDGAPSNEKVAYPKGKSYGSVLTDIAAALQQNLNQHGHPMLLIRDGQIYLGPRTFPLVGQPKELHVGTGLLEASADGASDVDPTAPDLSGAAKRTHFTLTLKGRPDIKPGDCVLFNPAPQDDPITTPGLGSALAGALAGPLMPGAGLSDHPTTLTVTSVRHRLGKSAGFVSVVRGVTYDPDNPWDSYSDTGPSERADPPSPTADAGANAASAIKQHLDEWTANRTYVDIGQVRAFTSGTSGQFSPSQTETVWEGLKEVDRNPNGSRRLPVDRNNAVRMDIPYASPFAWGKCGLALPRYPGMRVVLGHRRALDQDAVDLGAIWESGDGPDAQPGDWWLSLPVGVDQSARSTAADSDSPVGWRGAVTQDLTDADGNRMIELGSLVVRVGRNQLRSAGIRPDPPAEADSITIEHAGGGASIVMKQDGSIVIKGTSITIDAGTGNVSIKANKVDVQVADSMDVR